MKRTVGSGVQRALADRHPLDDQRVRALAALDHLVLGRAVRAQRAQPGALQQLLLDARFEGRSESVIATSGAAHPPSTVGQRGAHPVGGHLDVTVPSPARPWQACRRRSPPPAPCGCGRARAVPPAAGRGLRPAGRRRSGPAPGRPARSGARGRPAPTAARGSAGRASPAGRRRRLGGLGASGRRSPAARARRRPSSAPGRAARPAARARSAATRSRPAPGASARRPARPAAAGGRPGPRRPAGRAPRAPGMCDTPSSRATDRSTRRVPGE